MKKSIIGSVGMLTLFVLWTVLVCNIDVQPIGPQDSAVGFAGINQFVHELTGVHYSLYAITDWLGLVPIAVCIGFAILGLAQWISRKSIGKVDPGILVLGGFYILTILVYLFFEYFVINYRPVLIDGYLEVSYPSSTTLLVLCVMPTASEQLRGRIKNAKMQTVISVATMAFVAFMVIGRLVSGVHWFTDIVGGILLGCGLVRMYHFLCKLQSK